MKATILTAAVGFAVAACAHSLYAGEEGREVKALSDADIRGLREGAGMGFAKPAELNGYPGPMHVLELAEPLALSPSQREALSGLLATHKADARALGAEVVEAERRLDALFGSRAATAPAVDAAVAEVATKRAQLRASHLKAHLATTALLTPAQVERYAVLRGYGHSH